MTDGNIDDGGQTGDPRVETIRGVYGFHGSVSLRDYFAAHAGQDDIHAAVREWQKKSVDDIAVPSLAVLRYMHADAMLEARKRC